MTNPTIPDEAVDAAVYAFMLVTPCTYCDGQGYTGPEEHESHVDIFGDAVRAALTAALPHLPNKGEGMMNNYQPTVHPKARERHDRMTLSTAIQIAKQTVDEWDYEDDPHGYCHDRPVLAMLLMHALATTDDDRHPASR